MKFIPEQSFYPLEQSVRFVAESITAYVAVQESVNASIKRDAPYFQDTIKGDEYMKLAKRIGNIKPSAIRAVGKKITAIDNCISFAAGLPDPALFPSKEMKEVTDCLLTEKPHIALQYGMTKGYAPLIAKIVNDLNGRNIDCNVANIQMTTGSQQGISFVGMAFLDPGDVVLTENPTYLGALAAFRPYEVILKGVDSESDGMKMDALEDALKNNPRTKLIYLVPTFSNPSGRTWSIDKRKAVIQLANQYDVVIIEDNPYGDIRFEGEHLPTLKSLDTEERVVYLGSYSKILCAGLRVGYICAEQNLVQKIEIIKEGADLQTNQLAQIQVDELLEKIDLDAHIGKVISAYKEKRDLMMACIEKYFPKNIKYTCPEGGMFLWLELPEKMDANVILDKSLLQKVGFVPGGPFFPEGNNENTIRLNFSTTPKNNIEPGIKILGRVLDEAG